MLENRHLFHSLLPRLLFRIILFVFVLDGIHIHLAQMKLSVEEFVEGVRRMDRLVFFRRVFTGIFEYDLWTTGMFGEEFGHIV